MFFKKPYFPRGFGEIAIHIFQTKFPDWLVFIVWEFFEYSNPRKGSETVERLHKNVKLDNSLLSVL